MRMLKQQRGISGWGVLMMLIILGFAGLIGLKLFPIYAESFKIDAAIKGITTDPEVATQSKRDLYRSLIKRFYSIDDITSIPEGKIKNYVKITKKQGKVMIDVKYRRETNLFQNISIAVDFVKHAEN